LLNQGAQQSGPDHGVLRIQLGSFRVESQCLLEVGGLECRLRFGQTLRGVVMMPVHVPVTFRFTVELKI
jgi:hypothetical protein